MSRETDLLIDSVRVLLPEPTSVREIGRQAATVRGARVRPRDRDRRCDWPRPGTRPIERSSAPALRWAVSLTVLAPSDVERLPAGSAGALRKALRAGDLAVVPGDVAKAAAWWTVARSGFVRAIIEPGGWHVEKSRQFSPRIKPPQPSPNLGGRGGQPQPQPKPKQGKGQGGGNDYLNAVDEVAVQTTKHAALLGWAGKSGFGAVALALATGEASLAKQLGL